jgi:hypothetical protein
VITEEDAAAKAKEKLKGIKAPIEKRKIVIALDENKYKVVFIPPEGVLGGKYTFVIDAESGEILKSVIGR